MSGFVAESRWRHLGLGSALRERVGKQYTGTQRTRKAVHGECTVELAKWTLPIISLSREPYEAKVSRTGLTGGTGRRTVRQRALCLPSGGAETPLCSYHFPRCVGAFEVLGGLISLSISESVMS